MPTITAPAYAFRPAAGVKYTFCEFVSARYSPAAGRPAARFAGDASITAIGFVPGTRPDASSFTVPRRSTASTRPVTASWSIAIRTEPDWLPNFAGATTMLSAPPGPGYAPTAVTCPPFRIEKSVPPFELEPPDAARSA